MENTLMFPILFACIEMENKDVEDIHDDSASEEIVHPENGIMVGITEAHNVIRRAHGVDDLIWDEDLVVVSEEWIAHLDNNNCNMEHNWDSPLGENLFWANYETTNQVVVDSWASEEQHHD